MFASRLNWFAAAFAVVMTAIFLAAGVWQLRRAAYKDHLQQEAAQGEAAPPLIAGADKLDPRAVHLRRLEARGHWVPERTIFVDNKFHDSQVGYEVVTPLKVEASDYYLLVNRGWVKAGADRSQLPSVATPGGEVVVHGLARAPTNRFIELGSENIVDKVWQNLTIERYEAWSGMKLQPVVLYQNDLASEGLVRVQPAPEAMGINADRHRGYALTWFSLAAVTVVLSLLALRKKA